MRLTPDQESIVRSAIAKGLADSAEDFVSAALREKHAGATFDQFRMELERF